MASLLRYFCEPRGESPAGNPLPTWLCWEIIESLRLEKTSKNKSPQHHHVPKYHIYRGFEPLQGWGFHHIPGQPGPTPDHSFSQEIFPNIQSEPPLTQLEVISSSYSGEGTNTQLRRSGGTFDGASTQLQGRPWGREATKGLFGKEKHCEGKLHNFWRPLFHREAGSTLGKEVPHHPSGLMFPRGGFLPLASLRSPHHSPPPPPLRWPSRKKTHNDVKKKISRMGKPLGTFQLVVGEDLDYPLEHLTALSPLQPVLAASCVPRSGSSTGTGATGFPRAAGSGLKARKAVKIGSRSWSCFRTRKKR